MKLDFKLDFFYYQKQLILDGIDEDHEKLQPDAWKFKDYIKKASLEEVLELLIFSYAKEYANDTYWSTRFLDNIDEKKVYPKELDPYIDLFFENEEITRKEFNKIIYKMYEDSENNCYYTEWMYFEFTESQQLSKLLNAIKRGLKEVSYTERQEGGFTIIEPKESAILKITVSANDIKIDINPDKWRVYRGF